MVKVRRKTNDVDKTLKDLTIDYDQLNTFTKVCEKDIEEFRRELNVLFDKTERITLKELDNKRIQPLSRLKLL